MEKLVAPYLPRPKTEAERRERRRAAWRRYNKKRNQEDDVLVTRFQYQDKEGMPIRDTDMGPTQLAEMYFICKEKLQNVLIGIEPHAMTLLQKDALKWLRDHGSGD